MNFGNYEDEDRFLEAWSAVLIERPVHYSLFTFGESDLPYFLITMGDSDEQTVRIRRGEVKITRPTIITPDTRNPEFQGFFESSDEAGIVDFLLSRTAAFSNLKLSNTSGPEKIVSDSVEEAVDRLNRQLDDEEEDRVAILSAPSNLGSVAILKYATERVLASASDNIQELRERGFLP